MSNESKNYVLDQKLAAKKLERMSYEIWENNMDESEIILAGIRDRGSAIARHLQLELQKITPILTHVIRVDLDKDRPDTVTLSESLNFDDKTVILIDDVASSGKTLAYALKPFLACHPKKIQTGVLVERSHKTFPIHTDYVGLSLSTTLQDHIFVEVENDQVTGAYLA